MSLKVFLEKMDDTTLWPSHDFISAVILGASNVIGVKHITVLYWNKKLIFYVNIYMFHRGVIKYYPFNHAL